MRRFLIAAMTVAILSAAGRAAAVPPTCKLPATGQTVSYVKGDDGDVRAGGELSYTVNDDGTITDNNTGLMWERKHKPAGLQLPDAADLHGTYNCYPWQGFCSGSGRECGTDADCGSGETCAASDCQGAFPNGMTIFKWVAALNAQSFAGHNDWRIPNVKELDTIVNYGRGYPNPSLSPAFEDGYCLDPVCVTSPDAYWAATTFAFFPAIAWVVGEGAVTAAAAPKPVGLGFLFSHGPPNGNYVRAVRGESCGLPATGQKRMVVQGEDGFTAFGAALSYTDNRDGTITDDVTGLIWEKKIGRDNVPDPVNLHDADNRYFWRGSCSREVVQSLLGEVSANFPGCGTDADCPSGQTCIAVDGQGSGMTIFQWVTAVNAQNFAGHNDWRIPNVRELQSIVDYGVFSPAVDPAFNNRNSCGVACTDLTKPACSCTASAYYWSATSEFSDPNQIGNGPGAWAVGFDEGAVSGNLGFLKLSGLGAGNDFGKPVTGYVRAVRGGL